LAQSKTTPLVRRLILLFIFSSGLVACQQRQHLDHSLTISLQRAEMPAGQQLTAETLAKLRFEPFENKSLVDFNQGLRRQVLRLRLGDVPESLTDRKSNYVLLVSPPYVESVTHFIQDETGALTPDKRLSRIEYDPGLFFTPSHYAFEVGPHDLEKVHYLVVDNFSPYPLQIELAEASAFRAWDFKVHSLFVATFTVILTLAVVNLIFYVFLRKASYFFYSVYVLTFLLTLMWQEGWAAHSKILSLFTFGDYGYFLLSTLVGLSAWLFLLNFIGAKGLSGRLRAAALVWVWLYAVLFLVIVVSYVLGLNLHGHFFQLKQGMLLAGLISGVLTVLVSFSAWRRGNRQAGFLFLAWSIMMIAIALRMSYDLDPAADAFWRQHALEAGLMLEALVLFMGLADQTLMFMRERDTARKQFSLARRWSAHHKAINRFVAQAQQITQAGTDRESVLSAIDEQFVKLVDALVPLKGMAHLRMTGSDFEPTVLAGEQLPGCLKEILSTEKHEVTRAFGRGEVVEFWKACRDLPQVGHFLLLPVIQRENEAEGLLLQLQGDEPVDKATQNTLGQFAVDAWAALQNARQLHDLASDARYDPLTRVLNRRSIDQALEATLEDHRLKDKNFCVAFIDLDYFKDINDTYGHQVGDECLLYFARLLKQSLPDNALTGRYGGDEFLAILPETSAPVAKNVLHNFLQRLIKSPWGEKGIRFSSSIGLAEYQQGLESAQTLVRFADRALYHSKRNGRCQITVYDR